MSPDPASGETEALHRARALYDAGQYLEARTALLDALAPGSATTSVYRLLARIEHALNEPAREAHALEQALATARSGTASTEILRLWIRLGAVRAWQGDSGGALAAYERASRIDPDSLEPQQGMARARFALQNLEGVRKSVEELERRFPDAAFTHLFAGHAHKAFGDPVAARKCYLRALEREPTLGEALYNLVDLGRAPLESGIAARAADLSSRNDLAAADRINANFAYARILDREERYAEAFERFRIANELARDEMARQGIEYVPSRIEDCVARAISDYPSASFGSADDAPSIDLVPVFIIGLPRSGTTLIEQILASHRDVQSAGEIVLALECEETFRRGRTAAARTGPIDPGEPPDASLLENAREQYIEGLFERGLDGGWVVDKLPANFEIAGFMRLMFPRSPIIHSVRDPRATCFSLYCANFAVHEPWYHDLAHLAHYHEQYRRLMGHWRQVVPGPFAAVAYDRLVSDPQTEIPALLQAVGLPFDPSCLEFHRHRRPIFTASHAQVRRPVYTSSLDHWENYSEWLGLVRTLPVD